GEEKRLGLGDVWSAAQQAQIGKSIFDSHCGMLPATAVVAMSNAQRARDAIMADRMLSLPTGRAIAILGREHVRKDLAVPLYLQRRAPERTVLSIGLIETADGSIPEKYNLTDSDEPYDYIVMAKAVDRPDDPCEGMILPKNSSAP
ncbi:MAG: ChaN family lipoprotein, partial [Herminiimonas sp.]|nr:ChaN family lipoprotein [Herminiimonas sp.]